MSKMKIYEIARSMQEKSPDLKSKDVVKFLQENGFEAKSAQSTIEDDAIGFLLKNFNKIVIQKRTQKDNFQSVKESGQSKSRKTSKQERPAKSDNFVKRNKSEKNGSSKKPAKAKDIVSKLDNIADIQTESEPHKKLKEETKQEQTNTKIDKDSKTNTNNNEITREQETANGKRDNMNQNGQNNKNNNSNSRRDRRNDNRNNNNDNKNSNNRDNRRSFNQGQGRSNRNDKDNRYDKNDGKSSGRDSRNTGKDNHISDNKRENRNNDGRRESHNQGRDNRGSGRNNRDNRNNINRNASMPMDSMKSEVKQSRQQRPNKDSRSAKQKYGKNRDRNDMEDDIFIQPKNRKKKDPDRKGAFIKPEPVKKPVEPDDGIKTIVLPEKMTIKELSDAMKVQASTVIKNLLMRGKVVTLNHEIKFEEAEEIALEYNCIAEQEEKVDIIAEILKEDEEDESRMKQRPPVVCVMGHVDHGKTSLLDAIRETHVTSREAGGITQHIGAYVTEINGSKITFLDTPGHEAFTSMRMRGAQSTDIAILVVAADDGVMPQTIEAISHAKAAGVEIIVAVNKIDKPSANVERVKQELVEYGLVAEDWGGDTVFVPVSAHTKEGLDNLLEMIILTAEVLELKADPDRKARGVVIEAQLDKGRGPVATVLVQKGTLHVGDNIAVGAAYGKIRAMMDDKGQRVKEALPSTPVEILGLHDVPDAGEIFLATENDKEARNIAETYIEQGREKLLDDTKSKLTLDGLFSQIQAGNIKELNLIVKADVQGSVEAVRQSLLKLSNDEVAVRIIHGAVGAINESDVSLASASNAIIIGFNVRPDNTAKEIAEREKVDVRLYKVIYNAIEDIEAAMKGMLDPEFEEKVLGHLEVRQTFKASGVGVIAGSYVLDGKIVRGCKVRISREGELIFEGGLASLKRFKDDVKEVAAGYECGLVFEGFNDIKIEDTIEAYTMVEVPRT